MVVLGGVPDQFAVLVALPFPHRRAPGKVRAEGLVHEVLRDHVDAHRDQVLRPRAYGRAVGPAVVEHPPGVPGGVLLAYGVLVVYVGRGLVYGQHLQYQVAFEFTVLGGPDGLYFVLDSAVSERHPAEEYVLGERRDDEVAVQDVLSSLAVD